MIFFSLQLEFVHRMQTFTKQLLEIVGDFPMAQFSHKRSSLLTFHNNMYSAMSAELIITSGQRFGRICEVASMCTHI